MTKKLYIAKPDDRESVIIILARNGYTVSGRGTKRILLPESRLDLWSIGGTKND